MILTCKMMLEYLGLDEAAQKIEKALGEVLVESKPGTLTYDVLRDFRGDPDWEKNAASTHRHGRRDSAEDQSGLHG